MITDYIEFEGVLKLFELNGWVLMKRVGNCRVFMSLDKSDESTITIPVKDKKVSIVYCDRIKKYFEDG